VEALLHLYSVYIYLWYAFLGALYQNAEALLHLCSVYIYLWYAFLGALYQNVEAFLHLYSVYIYLNSGIVGRTRFLFMNEAVISCNLLHLGICSTLMNVNPRLVMSGTCTFL
jgi:hypothetical protein